MFGLDNKKLAEYCTMSIMAQSSAKDVPEYLILGMGRDVTLIQGDMGNSMSQLRSATKSLYDPFKTILDEMDGAAFCQLLHEHLEKVKNYTIYANCNDAISAICDEAAAVLLIYHQIDPKKSATTSLERTKEIFTILEIVYCSISQFTSVDDLSRVCAVLTEAKMSAATAWARTEHPSVGFDDRFAVHA